MYISNVMTAIFNHSQRINASVSFVADGGQLLATSCTGVSVSWKHLVLLLRESYVGWFGRRAPTLGSEGEPTADSKGRKRRLVFLPLISETVLCFVA
jgi:hypothetical protein